MQRFCIVTLLQTYLTGEAGRQAAENNHVGMAGSFFSKQNYISYGAYIYLLTKIKWKQAKQTKNSWTELGSQINFIDSCLAHSHFKGKELSQRRMFTNEAILFNPDILISRFAIDIRKNIFRISKEGFQKMKLTNQ